MFDLLISVNDFNDVPAEERIGNQNVTTEVQSITVNDVNIYKTCIRNLEPKQMINDNIVLMLLRYVLLLTIKCTYMQYSTNQASYVILCGGLLQDNQRLPNAICEHILLYCSFWRARNQLNEVNVEKYSSGIQHN